MRVGVPPLGGGRTAGEPGRTVGGALLGLLLACGPAPSDAYRAALAGNVPLDEALALCDQAGDDAEECVATVVRGHAEAPIGRCAALESERWRSECAFGIAEARAKAGDRWGALTGCGAAGAYYHECLYHAWTFELQLAADALDGGAVNGIDKARPIVAFWSAIETVGPGAEDLLWADWWYFAHARNKPAVYTACAGLPNPDDQRRCESGTRTFVRRSVVEALIRPSTPADTKDRICRGDPADVKLLLGELYLPDPTLDAELVSAVQAGCAPGKVERPWNPVFRARGAAPGTVPAAGPVPPGAPPTGPATSAPGEAPAATAP